MNTPLDVHLCTIGNATMQSLYCKPAKLNNIFITGNVSTIITNCYRTETFSNIMLLPILTIADQTASLLRNTNQQQKAKYKMHKFDYMIARMTALSVASKEGLRHITKIDFDQETESFFVYGTMFDLDPDTYENGRAPMFVRVTNGKIDLVDGV